MHAPCVNFDVFHIRTLHDTKQYIKDQPKLYEVKAKITKRKNSS